MYWGLLVSRKTAVSGVLAYRPVSPEPSRSRSPTATRPSRKSNTARERSWSRSAISPPVSDPEPSTVKRPSSTALSNVFEGQKPNPICMIADGSGGVSAPTPAPDS